MLNTPTFLGISMATQKSRRHLVVATYAILLATMIIFDFAVPWKGLGRSILLMVVMTFACDFFGRRGVFGRFAKCEPRQIDGTTSLALERGRRSPDELDEREVAIRNAAYFKAHRVLLVYGLILWALVPQLLTTSRATGVLWAGLLGGPMLMMLFTLPQAIILWTEPDVPEEVRG